MLRTSRLAALTAGGLVISLAGLAPTALAMQAKTLHLHGSMYARKAMATATVAQVSMDDYRIKITAQGLPEPAMLHVKPVRHAYVAWAIDGMEKRSAMAMAPLPLVLNKATGAYTANRVVMLRQVTRIVVTADRSAMQHMPTMPEVTVLDSAMKGM